MKNTNFNKKAFTLVELLVVIAIIAILFVVLISKVDFATDKAKTSGVQTDFRSFQMALHTVASEQQGFTSDLDELAVQLNRNLDRKLHVSVNGSEMVSNGKDPWGTNYKLTYAEPDNARGEVTVVSAGPDMKFNTDDDLKIAVKYALTENGADIIITGNTGAGQDYNQVGTPPPIVYEMLEGDGLIVTAADEAVFRSTAEISNFKNVKIGNTVLTENVDFVKTEGSTVITLTEDYVRSLENGEYTITIAAHDGYAMATFKVEIPRPTIDLLPGLYPSGTIQTYWNGNITKTEAEATLIQSWDELVASGNVTIENSAITYATMNTWDYDIVLSEDINSVGQQIKCTALAASINTSSISGMLYIDSLFIDSPTTDVTLDNCPRTSVYVGKNVSNFRCDIYQTSRPDIIVHEDNKNLIIEDGILYTKDYKTLIAVIDDGIETITIKDEVEIIASSAFAYCQNLLEVVIPDNVKTIESYAFYSCYSLTIMYNGTEEQWESLNIADGLYNILIVKSIFEYTLTNNEVTITGYNSNAVQGNVKINIPSHILGMPVVAIGDCAFSACQFLSENFIIPATVRTIGSSAFSGCSSLRSVTIPASVTNIGWGAFYGCDINTIYCEAESQPNGWNNSWAVSADGPDYVNFHRIEWGYTGN